MYFISPTFLIFFLSVTILFFVLPHKFRWLLLLVSSCFFYASAVPLYLLVLGILILINYGAGSFIEGREGSSRKSALIIGIIANLLPWFFFKYLNFFGEGITHLFGAFEYTNIVSKDLSYLPIGLSFHAFQGISYCVEIYRKKQQPEKNLGIFALYILFFPQVLAGPIERPQNLIKQFYEPKTLDYNNAVEGFRLMLWGIFKKVVIADRLSVYVINVFEDPHRQSGITLLIATIFFAFQFYADFSGYSDIVRGSAKVMGFNITENFKRPFWGSSIAEKCRRWHVSLYTWFRDYVYVPLVKSTPGGKAAKVFIGVAVVFLISGFWHGGTANQFAWAGIMIALIVLERAFKKIFKPEKFLKGKMLSFFGAIITLLLLLPAAIFFRTQSIGDATFMIQKIFSFHVGRIYKSENPLAYYYRLFGITLLFTVEFFQEFFPGVKLMGSKYAVVRFAVYAILITLILTIGAFDNLPFLYTQY